METMNPNRKCRGEVSIQKEIIAVVRDQYPTDWAKRLMSPEFKEATRQKLRGAASQGWCDKKTKECACA